MVFAVPLLLLLTLDSARTTFEKVRLCSSKEKSDIFDEHGRKSW